ncbi:MAG: hypothetical protein MZV49_09715 [Rhodopseudomonas palustris]|nr:hypothetical protein [Rhodopseudomonas palustris]
MIEGELPWCRADRGALKAAIVKLDLPRAGASLPCRCLLVQRTGLRGI